MNITLASSRWIGITLGALVACGGGAKEQPLAGGDSAATRDSLVPMADRPALPDTSAPVSASPETVYVDRSAHPAPKKAPPPAASTSAARPPAAAPEPAPAAAAPAPTPAVPSLKVGTTISTVAIDSIHSHVNKVGDPVRVKVVADVSDGAGKVVIPEGSVITLTIAEIVPAPNRGDSARLALSASHVVIGGESYPISARATDFTFELKARGIGGGEVAKTGAGAAAGALIGHVIGGKTGTIVGAVGGAAAGAAVAAKQADRDIIVHAGNPITLTLRDSFSHAP